MLSGFASAATPSTQPLDPQALLDKLRLQVSTTVRNASRYSCVETIERFWYRNRETVRTGCETDFAPEIRDRNLVSGDRLRLDVAVGSGQEIFSWHGQRRFQTEEIDRLVTTGPIGSGTYFSFLSSIFLDGSAKIDFRGTREENGQRLAVFGYSVPVDESRFLTRTKTGKDVMGYEGEFKVIASTGALEQLGITSTQIPESAQFCRLDIRARYSLGAAGGGSEFQLPAKVLMDILHENHEPTHSVIQYQECRQFLGQSELRFGDAPADAGPIHAKAARTLPAGLPLEIRIESSVNPETSWAGDAIGGELASDLNDENGLLLAPKGTPVHGRIVRMETRIRPYRYYIVSLQFHELTLGGEEYELSLKPVVKPAPESNSIRRRIQLENSPTNEDPGACRFRLDNSRVRLRGAVTRWMTN